MEYVEKYRRLIYLKEMLEKGQISVPADICLKFDCCNKTAREMINNLRKQGNTVIYNKQLKKYLLTE